MKPKAQPKAPPTCASPRAETNPADESSEPMEVFARRTTPYSLEALERPVYGFRNGKTVKVADRLRDILTPEDIAAAGGSLPPDPRLSAG